MSSTISIILCLCLIIGATFAVFTSTATVDIAVTAGTVKVQAEVISLKAWSLGESQPDKGITSGSAAFSTGGTATINADGSVTLDRIVPGHTVKVTIAITNESNVSVQYRIGLAVEGELADALAAQAEVVKDGLTETLSFVGGYTKWIYASEAGAAIAPVGVTVAFPHSDDNNDYQGKEGKVILTVEAVQGNAETTDPWDGQSDTSWFDATLSEFTLSSPSQLAGLSELVADGETFEGKTIKLAANMDLSGHQWQSIGSSAASFDGIFDGQGHTIYNIEQSQLSGAGGSLGLFGYVTSATVKNLNVDGSELYGYGPYAGIVAARAYGKCVFENITLTNNYSAAYNTGNGGIVGLTYWDSDYTFRNITVDESNTIASLWGFWDCPTGGIIGRIWLNGNEASPILMEGVDVSAKIDVYNDVCANYQWYAYRYAGMLIGYVEPTVHVEGTDYPDASMLTAKNVTVTYGNWANYRYCEWEKNGMASYSDDYKFSREDNNDFDSHVHTTEEQNNHNVLLVFDQLFGGSQGVYGDPDHEGVTVIYNNR